MLGVIRSFAQREAGPSAKLRDQWSPGIDVAGRRAAAPTPATSRSTWSSCSPTSAGWPPTSARAIAIFIDEMQDLGPDDVSALCAACHEISQSGLPVIVVGAGLPHLPAVLSASKSYSERLFRYQRIDRLARDAADRALTAPAAERGRGVRRRRAGRDVRRDRRLPLLHPGLRQGRLGPRARARRSPPTTSRWPRPEAEGELAVGFFGSRYERATPGEREYLRAMADAAAAIAERGEEPTPSARCPPPTSRPCSARSRSRSRRRATPCSRRASSTPASAAGSPSPCRTSAATCASQRLRPIGGRSTLVSG